jgi:NADPH-dependent 2,4-dienoyl-CoA reductase/sulfur reductase-like enzyme
VSYLLNSHPVLHIPISIDLKKDNLALTADQKPYHTMGKSREGWQWTSVEGLQPGLMTQAFVEPAQKIDAYTDVYDAIVIGAGYTGLTATRDLTTSGMCS